MKIVHRNALPFFWEGRNNVFCLLVHGFTGSPSDMRVLGEYLRDKGFGVSGLLLPGHGTTPEEMEKTSWPDWYRAVEAGYLSLKKDYPEAVVVPIGLSMGGILCLHLASRYKEPAVVSLSAPVFLSDRKAYLAPYLKYFYRFHYKPAAYEHWKKEVEEGQFYYRKTPVKALSSMLELIQTVKGELRNISNPVLIMQSRDDRTVAAKSAAYLYEHLGSTDKRLIWLEKSGHVITLGQEREQVFSAVEDFIRETGCKGGARG